MPDSRRGADTNMRSRFLLAGAFAALALAGVSSRSAATAQGAATSSAAFELYIDEVFNKRSGGQIESSVAFRDPLTRQLNPTLKVLEGERVTIRLLNRTQRPRSFAVMGVKAASAPQIAAGARVAVEFTAPARGNYIYLDPGQAGLSEARSLFGDLVVAPKPLHKDP
jgi:FtsP/CotA-like multicopper oxidase with cupredoxin domain